MTRFIEIDDVILGNTLINIDNIIAVVDDNDDNGITCVYVKEMPCIEGPLKSTAFKTLQPYAEIKALLGEYFLSPEPEYDYMEEQRKTGAQAMAILGRPVADLELSVRANNCMKNAGIRTVGQLVQMTERDIMKTRAFGKKSFKEVTDRLAENGLHLKEDGPKTFY